MLQPPHAQTDAAIAQELAEIGERLAGLAAGAADADSIGAELGAIRAQLRLLALDNAEIGARLGEALGLQLPAGDAQ
jgi:hypothetical protein